MTAQEVKSIIYKWKTIIDSSIGDIRRSTVVAPEKEIQDRMYALKIIGYILDDIQKEESKQ